MDQARSTISKIFNGEPHSYTRFNLTQNMEGDNSQVEMKLSSDMDEEVGGNGVGDHLNHNPVRKPYVAQKLGRTPKNLCFMAAATLLIFIIGYLIGYLVHRKKDLVPSPAVSMLPIEQPVLHETGAAPLMDWDDVKELLAEKLTATKFEPVFSEFTSNSHQAGSLGDEDLAIKVIKRFKEYGMNTWTDEHFVKVQDPPASGSNRVVFKDGKEERPNGFLSYSANGTVTGAVVYAHYGQESDLTFLQGRNINLNGRVVLVRAGRISFAEKCDVPVHLQTTNNSTGGRISAGLKPGACRQCPCYRDDPFNGDPHYHTHLNLMQKMVGDHDNREVEMMPSSNMDEEIGGNGVGDHLNHNPVHKPYVAQKFGCTPKNLCFMAAATLLIFIIGYLIGYLVHQKKDLVPSPAVCMLPTEQPTLHETGAAPLMDWDDVKELLAEKLTATKFEPVFSEFTSNSHQAGSLGDEDLAIKVIKRFKEYGMNTWTDEHFVKMKPQLLPKALTVQWLISAYGSYSRASRNLATEIQNSDLEDIEMCRIINDRIMAVERNFLSPYVSPKDSPFRHILLGSGPHTVTALSNHLDALRNDDPDSDADLFRNQFALATWTIQGCANSLAGDIWSLDNEI
ncbi:transferrin receptor protein 1-like [Seriola lalandi dorsalis]|uniref:transferrin receptor protein 1-like n=1 Tax=Seriola lalandi dorsalis TaxID=1841481 RepID=UPI000C6FA0C5|nr:transferrin receptor protein 1-like [Seriola lalandi dorsalis]